ncbi:MAG: tetratricopeptide repeat protein, partial [Geitlerinemataceae cyanobacterium]
MPSTKRQSNSIQEKFDNARQLQSQGKVAEAIAEYHAILALDKKYLAAWHQLAQLLEMQEKWDEAAEHYGTSIELDPQPPFWVFRHFGFSLYQQGLFDEAIVAYQKAIAVQPEEATIHSLLGQAFGKKGDIERAIESYQRAIELSPELPVWVYLNLGDGLIQLDRVDEAICAYEKALALEPENEGIQRLLEVAITRKEAKEQDRCHRAKQLQRQGLLDEALAEYRIVLAEDESNLVALHQVAQICETQEKWDEAIEGYRKAIEVDAQTPYWVYRHLGFALSQQRDVDAAVEAYEKAVELNPEDKAAKSLLEQIRNKKTRITSRKTVFNNKIHQSWFEQHGQFLEPNPKIEQTRTNAPFVEGFIDRVDRDFVSGWARDKNNPDYVVALDVFLENKFLGTCAANKFRQDLSEKFKNHGHYGFYIEIPPSISSHKSEIKVSVRVSDTHNDLGRSPATLKINPFGQKHESSFPFSSALSASCSNLIHRQKHRNYLSEEKTTSPLVSVIILSLNGAKLIDQLFRSFSIYNSYPNIELILVDHGSTDESLEVCNYWSQHLPIRVLARGKNHSFSNSNNFAARQTNSPFLLFLNNDITLCQDIIPQLISFLSDEKVGIVGAKLLDIIESKQSLAVPPIQHLGVQFHFHDKNRLFRPFDVRYSPQLIDIQATSWYTPSVTGALMMCRREDFFAIGGFHEDYFYGYEDMDLCLSMQTQLGKDIVCANNLAALHNRGFTRFKQNKEFGQRMANNRQTIESRFGYFIRRSHLRDFFSKGVFWTSHPLRIGFAVTEADMAASAGDYFTALELGEQLVRELGWEVFYLSKDENWYDMTLLDVLVVMRDDYHLPSLKNAKPSLVKVIWARNWFERLASREWVGDYDCIWSSSQHAADYLSEQLSKPVTVMRIATNADRFLGTEVNPEFSSDYCFTGSYWDAHREIIDLLEPENLPYKFALYGYNWEKVEKFKKWSRGSLSYTEIPKVYAATKIVIDDANLVTKEWGSVNSRVFDALGAGALVITNGVKGSEEVFGGLLPTYDSPESLEALLREYLTDEPKRLERVAQLQKMVLEQHTYNNRAHTVFSDLRDKMSLTFRISIKIGAPRWEGVEEWGDYHYALAMKRSFERQGHSVRIDILPEWDTPKAYGDDVAIVLRGLSIYNPKPHHINIMWNISHPDKISVHEYEQYDHVFVASQQYAEKLSKELTVPVQTLLQCTDPDLFYPDEEGDEEVGEVLFVGNSRKVYRKIVRDAIESGLSVDVYGTNWDFFLPPGYTKGEHIPNQVLRRYYTRCGVLLNDHWNTMRKRGFISNRLFDAAACGAKIISDEISGLKEVFGDRVVTYRSAEELPEIVKSCLSQREQTSQERIEFSRYIRENHTFEQRVGEMIKVIEALDREKMKGNT